jgi:hypothetical protein
MSEQPEHAVLVDLMKVTASELDMRFMDDYSGRFMYGETCVGVVGSQFELASFWSGLPLAIRETLGQPRIDNMGLDFIWYWPGV